MSRLVTVFGATGNQGNGLVRALLRDKQYVVRAVTRQPDQVDGLALKALGTAPQLEVVRGDMDYLDQVVHAVSGASAVFFSPHWFYWDEKELEQTKIVTSACKSAGVKHILFGGADRAHEETGLEIDNWYFKEKSENFMDADRTPVTKLRMSWYFENLLVREAGFLPVKEKEDGSFAINIPLNGKALHMISARHAGRAMKAIIDNPKQYIGKTIGLSAGSYTGEDIAAALNKHVTKYTFYDGKETLNDHHRREYDWADRAILKYEYYQKDLYKRDPELTKKLDPDTPNLDAWVQERKEDFVKLLDFEADLPVVETYKTEGGKEPILQPIGWLNWRQYLD